MHLIGEARQPVSGPILTAIVSIYMMIDAPIGRAHQHSASARKNGEQAIGRSRGGLSTKIHALVDAVGNPVNLMLTPGQVHDLACAVTPDLSCRTTPSRTPRVQLVNSEHKASAEAK
jgi:hypothetical protein